MSENELSDGAAAALEDKQAASGHPVLMYNLLRVALLFIVGTIGYLVGLRGIPLILFAFLVSMVFSFFLLRRQRNAVGERVGDYFERMNNRIESEETFESAEDINQSPAAEPSESTQLASDNEGDTPEKPSA